MGMDPSTTGRPFDEAVWDLVMALEPLLERRRSTEAALQDLWGVWERLSPLSASVRESSQAISSASNALRKMAVTLSVEISRHRLHEDSVGSVARELWAWSERMAESARSMAMLLTKVQQTVTQLEDGLRTLREQSEQEVEAADELLLHAERLQALLERQHGRSAAQTQGFEPHH